VGSRLQPPGQERPVLRIQLLAFAKHGYRRSPIVMMIRQARVRSGSVKDQNGRSGHEPAFSQILASRRDTLSVFSGLASGSLAQPFRGSIQEQDQGDNQVGRFDGSSQHRAWACKQDAAVIAPRNRQRVRYEAQQEQMQPAARNRRNASVSASSLQ